MIQLVEAALRKSRPWHIMGITARAEREGGAALDGQSLISPSSSCWPESEGQDGSSWGGGNHARVVRLVGMC